MISSRVSSKWGLHDLQKPGGPLEVPMMPLRQAPWPIPTSIRSWSCGQSCCVASQYSRLETGKCFKDYCKPVIAIVSDQGTEHLIADCGPISTEHVREDDAVALRCVWHFRDGFHSKRMAASSFHMIQFQCLSTCLIPVLEMSTW